MAINLADREAVKAAKMMRSRKLALLLLGTLLVWMPQSFGQECEMLRATTPQVLTSFLNNSTPNVFNEQCVDFAIAELGRAGYEPAIPVLAKYLDFAKPLTENEKIFWHPGPLTLYPAAGVLNDFGSRAIAALLQTIELETSSPRARKNALLVFWNLHKYESAAAVAFIVTEANKMEMNSAKERLKTAAV